MHEHTRAFVRTAAEAFELKGPVYEFGFCPAGDLADAEAMRECFPQTGYIGCEVHQPAEIDRLPDLSRLPFPDAAARTVICADTLEHVYEPPRAVEEMARILMPGGVLVLSAAVEPGDPAGMDNYWRLTPHAVERLLSPFEATLVAWQGPEGSPHTVYGVGCKAPAGGRFVHGMSRFMERFRQQMETLGEDGGWLARLLRGWRRRDARGKRPSKDDLRAQFVVHLPLGRESGPHFLLGLSSPAQTGTRLDLRE